jgi:polysaccharide pyruvyl transferase WcaK-like protein
MRHDDIMFLTGGDMMCYDDNEVIYTNNLAYKYGIKSVLWGCSIGKSNLTPAKIDTLSKFSCIYARESLTYELLRSLNLKNILLYPDPAFVLLPEECSLPILFQKGNVIGLNFSNYVVGGDNLNTPFGSEIRLLIDYIISATDLNILLIPHVLWKGQDDRLISQDIINTYNSERIAILDSANYNYEQIRYVISKCLLFIGARTHAIISAYSTCTPAIALGYSVKARGIANDLQLDENVIIDSRNFRKKQLLESFIYTWTNLENIKSHLELIIPTYVKKLDSLKSELFEKLKI